MNLDVARRRAAAGMVAPALGLALAFGLAACSSPPPPPPPPTVVNLSLSAGPDSNPTASGQGAPVVIRVYQLSSPAGFEKAEFFRLLNQDTATLGSDVVKKDEYLLPPGGSKTATLTPPSTVKALGVFAAYRDFQHTTWRGVAEFPEHKTTDVLVRATASGIDVSSKTAPAAPSPKPAS